MRAIMTGGEAVKGGGKVVKNVAGYDVCKLFTGAWGTLGVLTRATVRVQAVAQASDYRAWLFPDFASGVEAVRTLEQDGVPLATVRLSYPVSGREESPSPRRSGAITVYFAASTGMMWRHSYQVCGQPWISTSGGPDPMLT